MIFIMNFIILHSLNLDKTKICKHFLIIRHLSAGFSDIVFQIAKAKRFMWRSLRGEEKSQENKPTRIMRLHAVGIFDRWPYWRILLDTSHMLRG
jgi:hypothetical protein